MEILAKRLKILRKERGLRQADVAADLGISTVGYQRYELDQREPGASLIAAIANYYQVSTDYLLGLKDER